MSLWDLNNLVSGLSRFDIRTEVKDSIEYDKIIIFSDIDKYYINLFNIFVGIKNRNITLHVILPNEVRELNLGVLGEINRDKINLIRVEYDRIINLIEINKKSENN